MNVSHLLQTNQKKPLGKQVQAMTCCCSKSIKILKIPRAWNKWIQKFRTTKPLAALSNLALPFLSSALFILSQIYLHWDKTVLTIFMVFYLKALKLQLTIFFS